MKSSISSLFLVFTFCSCQIEQESLIEPNFEVQVDSNKSISVDLKNESGLLSFEQVGTLPFYSHLNIEFLVHSYWYIDPQMGELITKNEDFSYSFDISINQTMRAHEPIYLREGNTISKVRIKHFDMNRNAVSVREFDLSNPLRIEKDIQYDLKILVDKILTNNGAEGFEWQVSK